MSVLPLLLAWLLNTLIIIASAYLLPGVHIESFVTALVASLILGIINATLKPLLVILTLPITLITFGLFYLVLNALIIMLATLIVPGFSVDSFWWALLFSIVISIFNFFLQPIQELR